MSGLKKLINEIHRRSLWQVLGIYLAVSWVVFEVAQTLTEGMGVTIIHEGRGFEASILSVEDGNLGARIVFEVDPPWPIPTGP